MMPESNHDNGAPTWALTFGDLMMLMLTFFVLLTSFATIDARRFAALSRSLQAGFGGASGSELVLIGAPGPAAPAVADAAATSAAREEAAQAARLRMAVQQLRLERVLEVESTPRGVVLRAPALALFGQGSSELRGEALPLLHEIAGLLDELPGDVSIEGHADDAAATGPASFELSAARALAALRHLAEVEGLDVRRLRATGFGDVRPLFANSGPLARERNRRVEFVLLRGSAEGEPRALAELGSQTTNENRKAR